MELPDFDTLKKLASSEPSRLDAILEQQIDQLMARASPDQQRRLRGLQFKIDGQRRLAKNNLDSCIRIANMMRESFYLMRSEMIQFREERGLSHENDSSGKIIRLADYQHRK
ncbi:MAG: DUF3135 domain-containing protein [Aeromonas sp.]|uniref:DUF3135 domain-containing protein n=1 Tax=Aeromonas sp. TaxID=647 RepID=UPI003D6C5961